MNCIKLISPKWSIFFILLAFMPAHKTAKAQNMRQMEVVYSLPGMDEVEIKKGVIYKKTDERELTIDLYYPASTKKGEKRAAVIFVLGYSGIRLKDMQQYISWGKLVAVNGHVGINYETTRPKADIEDLINYIRKHADDLNIDKNRIGIWSCSANSPVGLWYLSRYEGEFLKFGVFYYGIMPTASQRYRNGINLMAKKSGFIPATIDKKDTIPVNLPMFIVRAGQDRRKTLNKTIEHFLINRLSVNAPVTFVNYKSGHHAFDIVQDNRRSRLIIKQTLNFINERFE